MPFAHNDCVAILTVRDTGVVTVCHPTPEYDEQRDQAQVTGTFPEPDLALLADGSRLTHRQLVPLSSPHATLLRSVYKNRKGRRTVKTIAYRIRGGHNMGRLPR